MIYAVRFEVLTAVNIKMAVLWVVAMMEAASTLETWVKFSQTTRYKNPEDSHHHDLFPFLSTWNYTLDRSSTYIFRITFPIENML
jgi:hypothetical protein